MRSVLATAAAVVLIPVVVAVLALAALTPHAATTTAAPAAAASATALSDIPATFLTLYRRDGRRCPGLDWATLAAIGKTETDHARARLPGVVDGENHAGAAGPMQFLAPTFTAVIAGNPPPPGGARPPSRYDPSDAVHAAAAYLCDSGLDTITRPATGPRDPDPDIRRGTRTAIWTYNHSQTYIDTVLTRASNYRTTTQKSTTNPSRADDEDTDTGARAPRNPETNRDDTNRGATTDGAAASIAQPPSTTCSPLPAPHPPVESGCRPESAPV